MTVGTHLLAFTWHAMMPGNSRVRFSTQWRARGCGHMVVQESEGVHTG
jgi:hypothetical protein